MSGANLIPMARLATRAQARRRRAWVGLFAGWVAVIGAVYAACFVHYRSGGDAAGLPGQIESAQRQVAESNRAVAALRPQIAELQSKIQTNRAVGRQPDWSALLALLAQSRPDEVVLSGCNLIPSDAAQAGVANAGPAGVKMTPVVMGAGKRPGVAAAAADQNNFVVRLRGFSKSQAAISQYTLRLEQLGLFDKVAMVKMNREAFLSGEALAFQLDCTLRGAPATSGADSTAATPHAGGKP